jgi:putative lipoic acid-binding regulatory protein
MSPQLPSIELIESIHKFPGEFTFKVIGDSRPDFAADALNSAFVALGQDRNVQHSARQSAAGNHTAVTLSVPVKNGEEVHAVYQELLKIPGVRALF